jgi:GNAT superfamily N-acetyltransferase
VTGRNHHETHFDSRPEPNASEPVTPAEHPLATLLQAAARGRFPPPDGAVEILPPLNGKVDAVVAFTAHSAVAVDLPADNVRAQLDPDDFGATMSATFLAWVSERLGTSPGVLDNVLVAPARALVDADLPLVPRDDLADHPRVARATRYRTDLHVFTDESGAGVLLIGRGLAGRWEMAFEVDGDARGRGVGRALAAAAPTMIPEGEYVFAQASPGNAASVRAVLAAGYSPIGSECLFARR